MMLMAYHLLMLVKGRGHSGWDKMCLVDQCRGKAASTQAASLFLMTTALTLTPTPGV